MFACCWANRSRCSMGAGIPRCGSIVGIGLPKIISAGDGSPVSIGVARKCELYVFTVSDCLPYYRLNVSYVSFDKSVAPRVSR